MIRIAAAVLVLFAIGSFMPVSLKFLRTRKSGSEFIDAFCICRLPRRAPRSGRCSSSVTTTDTPGFTTRTPATTTGTDTATAATPTSIIITVVTTADTTSATTTSTSASAPMAPTPQTPPPVLSGRSKRLLPGTTVSRSLHPSAQAPAPSTTPSFSLTPATLAR